jgi:hypothetical protein
MAEKHPYMSGSAGLVKAINQLRKSFPSEVTADTLKKLGIAPNNETYVINILRFTGVLDSESKKTEKATDVFTKHDDAEFQKGLSEMVEGAYADMFELHGKDAWVLTTDQLISYFRSTDHTSELVGKRQAGVFLALSSLCGHGPALTAKPPTLRKGDLKAGSAKAAPINQNVSKAPARQIASGNSGMLDRKDVGLTVRIEVNLPAVADQEIYDKIFKSIRENLLNAK